MIGLRSQFGPSLTISVLVIVLATVAAVAVAVRARAAGRSPPVRGVRVLAIGAIATTVVATALPRRWAIETDGDLVLALGSGGLAEWPVLLDDPTSLAAVLLVANALLYAAVSFTSTLGWFSRRGLVLPACLALSVLIEVVQFSVLGRVAAVDDVVLNLAGAVFGQLGALVLIRWSTRSAARRRSLTHTASDAPLWRHTGRHAPGDRRLPAGLSRRV